MEGWSDRVITIDKKSGDETVWDNAKKEIAASNIGVAFIPHRSYRSGKFLKSIGIPVRIGFDRGGGRKFHTIALPHQIGYYEGRRNLSLLRPFSQELFNELPELYINASSRDKIRSLMNGLNLPPAGFIVFAPASVWKTKAWPVKHYYSLSKLLDKNFNLPTVAVGGNVDGETCSHSVQRPEFNLAGKLSPLESAELMRQSRFVISGDSAAAHLATSVGARQVIIFGSTAPRFGFSPFSPNVHLLGMDLGCRPCTDHGRQKCPLHRTVICLENITPELVLKTVNDWLALNDETAVNSVDNDE